MPQQSDDRARARAEALFKRREGQKADAPVAMAEYRAAQAAAVERMSELRRLRLARDAELASPKGQTRSGKKQARRDSKPRGA